jgi:hypothetical protein
MVDLNERLFLGILSAMGIGLLSWLAVLAKSKTRDMWDRRKVYCWLQSNTRDQTGETHVDTVTVAKGTRLPEERVRRACMSDKRIHRFPNKPEQWSVWRKEPQSAYEKRGILRV